MSAETQLIVAIRSPAGQKQRRDAIRETWGKAFLEHGAQVFFCGIWGDCSTKQPTT